MPFSFQRPLMCTRAFSIDSNMIAPFMPLQIWQAAAKLPVVLFLE